MTINFQKVITTYTTNWPAKLACFLLGLCFTFSCKDPKNVSLERQLSENPAGVFYTDTFQVSTETIQLENPSTRNQPHLIIGKYQDADIGLITCEANTQLALSADTLKLFSIDNIIININYNFILGDPSKALILNLFPLKQSFSDSVYTRQSVIGRSDSILQEFTIQYDGLNSASFSGNDNLKKFFLSLTGKNFKNSFKGFAFVPQGISYAIGMSTGTSGFSIKIKGSEKTANDTISKEYTMFIDNSSNKASLSERFTKAVIADSNASIFSKTNPLAYMNDMIGIGAKITIPGLNSFLNDTRGKYVITDAFFLIPSDRGFQQETRYVFPVIYMYETDKDGNRYKRNNVFQLVQEEFDATYAYLPSNLNQTGNDMYRTYTQSLSRFTFPYTLHTRDIQSGKLANNPLVAGIRSTLSNRSFTQSPFTFTFPKSDISGKKIQFVVYYNKIGQ